MGEPDPWPDHVNMMMDDHVNEVPKSAAPTESKSLDSDCGFGVQVMGWGKD